MRLCMCEAIGRPKALGAAGNAPPESRLKVDWKSAGFVGSLPSPLKPKTAGFD